MNGLTKVMQGYGQGQSGQYLEGREPPGSRESAVGVQREIPGEISKGGETT
jgi:hypothetical protein